jgi:membrane-associated phospholipid phosphatase
MFSGVCALTIALALQASPPPASSRPPVSANIFKEFGHDFRAMPSSANAAILGFGAGAAAVLRHDDTRVANWSLRRGPAAYTPAGDRGGNGWVQASLALATYGIGVASRSPRGAEVGGDLVRGQLLAGIVTQVLKSTVDRTRPTGGSRSFPSGHTSATFLTAAVLQGDLGWKVGAPAYAAATFVAW